MRIRNRLVLFFLAVIAVGASMTYLTARRATEDILRSFIFSGDADKARVYASILADYYGENRDWGEAQAFLSGLPSLVLGMFDSRIHGERGGDLPRTASLEAMKGLLSDRVVVADSAGRIVADSSGALLGTLHPERHLAQGIPVMVEGRREGTVLVGSMIDLSLTGYNEEILRAIAMSLLWSTIVSAAIAFGLGLLFTAQVTRPLARLTEGVERVARGDLSTVIDVRGRDELGALSASFNTMTAELRRLEEARKRIIADSAHELRTPVSLIQGTVEGMIDGIYPLDLSTLESVHGDVLRLSRLIDTLRELELIDSGRLGLKLETVDLRELAVSTVASFRSAALAKDIRLDVDDAARGQLVVEADRLRLGEVLYNLVANAIAYCPQGGRVELGLAELPSGFRELRVEDSGPGIAPEERERVFERFYRVDKSRATVSGGQGLGLSIAAEIAEAHGGSIRIEDSKLGGVAFVVSLPALRFQAHML